MSGLLVHHIVNLLEAVWVVREIHPFQTLAWVVLPGHMHWMWRLPDGDSDYWLRWGLVNAGFSRAVPEHERLAEMRSTVGRALEKADLICRHRVL